MSCLLFNAQSVKNKLNELHHLIHTSKYDIICVTETWLNDTVPDNIITDTSKYSVHRTDRKMSRGGGVMIITHNHLPVNSVKIPPNFDHLELCAVDIVLPGSPVRLFTCYRPPSSNRDPIALAYITDLCTCLEMLLPRNGSIIITGDFNFPDVNWSSLSALRCCSHTCPGVFLNFFFKHSLCQFVDSPTRSDHILDIVVSNDVNCIANVTAAPPFSTSDHTSVQFNVVYRKLLPDRLGDITHTPQLKYNFQKADWSNIRCYLAEYDFNEIFNSDFTTAVKFQHFYTVLNHCIHLFVPLQPRQRTTTKSKRKYPLVIRKLQQKKLSSWRRYRRSRSSSSLNTYKRHTSEFRRAVNKHITQRENSLIETGNLGAFYRYANNKLASHSTIGPLSDTDGALIIDPRKRAELLNNTFKDYFTIDNHTLPQCNQKASPAQNLSNVIFTTTATERAMKKLKITTAGGPDGIPPIFLKHCIKELCGPLTVLFELSFEYAYLPPEWKMGYVTPIFKKGARTDPRNYRPIVLTSSLCKLMESIIKDQLVSYFHTNNFFTKHQHAFLVHHSTATNLLECTFDWSLSLHSSFATDVVYIDFARAFDSIVFAKLLFKLELYGISGNLLKWISGFISNRVQCVVLENIFSNVSTVLSGVPQGSVLGPILFIIFINDIVNVCEGNAVLKLFADDAKLFAKIVTNSSSLQSSLDNLIEYAHDSQLSINISKCFFMSICKSISCKPTQYLIEDKLLDKRTSASDLGVIITTDMDFKQHISSIVSRALQRSGVFFRGFTSRDLLLLRKAFITYIRPIVEYNTVIWNPTAVHLTDLVESVQRKFSKRIHSISHLTYAERLLKLNLESLELRRLRFDLIHYFKFIVLKHPDDLYENFLFHNPPLSARASSPILVKPPRSSAKLDSSFFYRHTKAWNSLPSSLKSSRSLHSFKRGLLKINLDRFLIGSMYHFK